MYKGVPTFTLSLKPNLALAEKPKSLIFHLFPTRNIFAGFMSLCMIPWVMRCRYADAICVMIYSEWFSDSLFFWAIYSFKLPWGQYYMTR